MEKTVFKEGDKVFHIEYGWGEVIDTEEDYSFPVVVKFDNSQQASFLESGKELPDSLQPMLSFTEYTLQGFSQERPIELPEVGEEVMVSWNGDQWSIGKFYEHKNGVFYTKDDNRIWLWHHIKRLR